MVPPAHTRRESCPDLLPGGSYAIAALRRQDVELLLPTTGCRPDPDLELTSIVGTGKVLVAEPGLEERRRRISEGLSEVVGRDARIRGLRLQLRGQSDLSRGH